MKQFIIEYLWIAYLGGALGTLGIGFTTWQYWAIMLPVIFLQELAERKKSKL
jgi:hypothetical protein